LVGPAAGALAALPDLAALFTQPSFVGQTVATLVGAHKPWRGELALLRPGGEPLPVSLRAEVVPGRDGELLGFILILLDLSDAKRAEAARRHLEQSLSMAVGGPHDIDARAAREPDAVVGAILANASLAAMDIADGPGGPTVAPLLEEIEASTRRAAMLCAQIRTLGRVR
jgi:hypothetical protein